MSSKSQAHREKKSVSKQRSSRSTTRNLNVPAREAHLAATVQRAKLDPGSLTPRDVLQLQRTIGNRAIIQRMPDYYAHKNKKDGREVKVSEQDEILRVDVIKGNTGQWAKLEYDIRNNEYVLHEIESHPPAANLGAILVYYLAKKANAINQQSMAVDMPAASVRGFYKGMGFKLVEGDLQTMAQSEQEFKEVLAIAKIRETSQIFREGEERDKFPIEIAIRTAETIEQLFELTPTEMLSSLQALLQVAMKTTTVKAIPGLQDLDELQRLKYFLRLKQLEIATPMRGATQDILTKSKASMDKRWKKKKCYLTSACVQFMELADDCHELTTLRAFRDEYLQGTSMVEEYYRIAPAIVSRIDEDEHREQVYRWIYGIIQQCVGAIERERFAEAVERYRRMSLTLKERYCVG